MDRKRIEAYAKLVIETGLNLQKGQTLVINSSIETADFARLCVSEAYARGCKEVIVKWTDNYVSRERYLKADDSVFDSVPSWQSDFYNYFADERCGWLRIESEDPEALAGIDPDRIARGAKAFSNVTKNFRNKQMTSYFPWCIVAVPGKAWAKKVFPELGEEEAVEALWEAILSCMRVWENSDPVEELKKHISVLKDRVEKLNSLNLKYLVYKNSLGTDLTVELPEGHYWEGGDEKDSKGVFFCANMPTEEIFTVPKRDGVNGIVYSTKPLSINGSIADNFVFTFKDGKIVDIKAEKGLELLKTETSIDDGAPYLGEVALVPYDSPISNSGILFYNTLFDENASCHLAFGDAYPLISGGKDMDEDQLRKAGVNTSFTHTDFMVGSPDLSINGITKTGEEIPIFIDGNFAF